ncbi:MAG: fibronectin type III-like domain-contianing protein, partial [Aristaeellaceae bacterium]
CAGQWQVSLTVRNTGAYPGRETVQLYIAPQQPKALRPRHELKAFESVRLEPGEEKRVTFVLDRQALAWYSEDSGAWVVDPGVYEVQLGASSRDIRLSRKMVVA